MLVVLRLRNLGLENQNLAYWRRWVPSDLILESNQIMFHRIMFQISPNVVTGLTTPLRTEQFMAMSEM